MSIYAEARAALAEVFADASDGIASSLTLRKTVVAGAYDTTTGRVSTGTTEDHVFRAKIEVFSTQLPNRTTAQLVPQGGARPGDMHLLVIDHDLGFSFELGDLVGLDGAWWHVVAISPEHDDDQVVLRELLIRKGEDYEVDTEEGDRKSVV